MIGMLTRRPERYVIFCTDENFQTYLDFMKKLYDEGLVSQDFAAMNAVQGREVFNTQKVSLHRKLW